MRRASVMKSHFEHDFYSEVKWQDETQNRNESSGIRTE